MGVARGVVIISSSSLFIGLVRSLVTLQPVDLVEVVESRSFINRLVQTWSNRSERNATTAEELVMIT